MTDQRLPHLLETHMPVDQAGLVSVVRDCYASRTAIYPIGGATSLAYGLAPRLPGIGLVTTGMSQVIDYPARDMTITAEAGIRVADLQRILATERQTLPIDVSQSELATLAGIIACDTSGPRRYLHGTLRDYVIGISAVDGRGVAFKAGGRVVKNVAGYDFCKLLTGSLGTLAVITQVTLKVKPLPQRTALIVARLDTAEQAEAVLNALAQSQTTPAAIELLLEAEISVNPQLPASPVGMVGSGESRKSRQAQVSASPLAKPGAINFGSQESCTSHANPMQSSATWATLAIRIEGTEPEVAWMIDTLRGELRLCSAEMKVLDDGAAESAWQSLIEFPAGNGLPGQSQSTTLQLSVPPSRTVSMIQLIRNSVSACSIQAHAGNGIIVARLDDVGASDVSRILVSRLQPAAQQHGGRVVVLHSPTLGELTRQAVWGAPDDSVMLMNAVKQQFDPHGLLNPGRFVYTSP